MAVWPLVSIKSTLLANAAGLQSSDSVVHSEFIQLVNSSCINLLDQNYNELYQEIISPKRYQDILNKCSADRIDYQFSCDSKIILLINEVPIRVSMKEIFMIMKVFF